MKRILRITAWLVLILTLGLTVRQWGFSAVRIAGSSMEDTLHSDDVTLVTRLAYALGAEPERDSVVECRFPNRDGTYVKRIIGIPGDSVTFSEGQLYLNGRGVSEPYVTSQTEDFSIQLGEDEYFVLGDNRAESYDSRASEMGCISRDCILGRVRFILWPFNHVGMIQ